MGSMCKLEICQMSVPGTLAVMQTPLQLCLLIPQKQTLVHGQKSLLCADTGHTLQSP
jgi:hypothetical protein